MSARQASPAAAPGRFIVFEGGEGTGKSTQARLLAGALERGSATVILTREPGGAPGAEAIRRLLLEDAPALSWSALSEALLHYAARCEHLDKTIRPALRRGAWVISDRFADSTAAYQGAGLALPPRALQDLRRLVVAGTEPDLTIVLDLADEVARRRLAARPGAADRYERMEAAFHRRVRQAFLDLAAAGGGRYAVVDGAASVDAVHQAVLRTVRSRLGAPGAPVSGKGGEG